jgi:hypothetical protein
VLESREVLNNMFMTRKLYFSQSTTKWSDMTEIEDYVDQQASSSVDYAFSFQPKPIEPFKKMEFMKKSDYWKLLSDFILIICHLTYRLIRISTDSIIVNNLGRWMFRELTGSAI